MKPPAPGERGRSCPGSPSRLAGLLAALLAGAAALPAAPVASVAPILLPGTPVAAQEVSREEQIPFDPDRGVTEVGPDLRRDLELFPEVRGFVAARLFRTDAGGTVLEISFRQEGRLLRERRRLAPDELRELRRELDRRFTESGREGVLVAEGRGGLVLGQTLLGLGFHGWAVPELLGLENDRATVATYLLVSAASFYVPYRATRRAEVRDVHRNMALWGGTRGLGYGLLLGGALTGRPEYGDRTHLGLALAGSLAGSLLGYLAVDRIGLDEGAATLWTTTADAGTLAGLGAAYVSGFYDDVTRVEYDPRTDRSHEVWIADRERPRAADLTALATSGAGMVLGHRLARMQPWTVGDAYGLRSTIALGAQAALPVAELAVSGADGRGKPYVAGMLAGGAGGLVAGVRLFRDRSFSPGDGLLLNAGHLAGGLAALGLTWVAAGDDASELLYTSTTALGSIGGFALTYRALSARPGSSGAVPGEAYRPGPGREAGIRIELSPGGLLTALAARRRAGPAPGGRSTLLRVRF